MFSTVFCLFRERFLNYTPSVYQYSISFEHDHRISVIRKAKIRVAFRLEMMSQLSWKNNSWSGVFGMWMNFALNRMFSRCMNASSESRNRISICDPYLSDPSPIGIIQRWVSFGSPTSELTTLIRSSSLFRTVLNEWVSTCLVIATKWLAI